MDHAYQYRKLFPALIDNWRKHWNQGKLPFLFVQLANFETSIWPGWMKEGCWPELREAQLQTLSIPDTAMAVTIDIGEPNNIHPKNKQEVGRRLALAALAKYYGKNMEYSGPVYSGMKIDKGKFTFTFHILAEVL